MSCPRVAQEEEAAVTMKSQANTPTNTTESRPTPRMDGGKHRKKTDGAVGCHRGEAAGNLRGIEKSLEANLKASDNA